ncbi:hypothetical protein [Nocardioides sp.]|uniref:hypothetical protein n=1 Tax=Nocardioides sp. TaxID=35761 RepID=UPI0019C29C1B|nr:hypothetical protein [Nocardioides sp.]MBC7277703.1 hypothetical protein [Nocardioides sp.]
MTERTRLWMVPLVAAAGWGVGFLPQIVQPQPLLLAPMVAELVSFTLLAAALGGLAAGLAAGLRPDRRLLSAALAGVGVVGAAYLGLTFAAGPAAANPSTATQLIAVAAITTAAGLIAGIAASLGPYVLRAPMLAAPAVCVPLWLDGMLSGDLPSSVIDALLAAALVTVLVTSVRRAVDVVAWVPAWILGWAMQTLLTVLVAIGVLIQEGRSVDAGLLSSHLVYFHERWNEPAVHYPAGWALAGVLALALVAWRLRDNLRV